MRRKRVDLFLQILLFVLFTLLGIATGYLTNEHHPPALVRWLERSALPFSGVAAAVIVGVMVWQHLAEQRGSRELAWDSDRPPYPGLEAFTEQDAGVFFGRSAETSELVERLHPVGDGRANRFVAVIGPSGVGK